MSGSPDGFVTANPGANGPKFAVDTDTNGVSWSFAKLAFGDVGTYIPVGSDNPLPITDYSGVGLSPIHGRVTIAATGVPQQLPGAVSRTGFDIAVVQASGQVCIGGAGTLQAGNGTDNGFPITQSPYSTPEDQLNTYAVVGTAGDIIAWLGHMP